MVAITSYTERTELKLPGLRAYTTTATDTDTFTPPSVTAKKAWAVYDADPATGNPIECIVSGGVVTTNCTSLSSTDALLFVICED